jgi:proteic killer suppression protein
MDIRRIILSNQVEKNLLRVPKHIVTKLNSWVELVTENGLNYARRIPGYHDEPLKGDRKGQRSIRLSKSCRAIYVICADDKVEFVEVREVNKHEY